jgi:hypothetical protein
MLCPDCSYCLEWTLRERPHDSLYRSLSVQQAETFCLDDWPDYDAASIHCDGCPACQGQCEEM